MQAIPRAELLSLCCLSLARVHYIAVPHRANTACICSSTVGNTPKRRVCWAAAQMQTQEEQVRTYEPAACTSSLPVLTAVPADVGCCCTMGSPFSV